MKYFEVDLTWNNLDGEKLKKVNEKYLVDAESVTEAEAQVIGIFVKESPQVEVTVKGAKESKIIRVIEP